MAQNRFLIAPLNEGVDNSVKPWLIPDNAFERLENAYVFRGRVRKRFGSRIMKPTTPPEDGYESLSSRLRIKVTTTDGVGAAAGNVPGAIFSVGQMFSIGNQIYTVNVVGNPAPMLNTGDGLSTFDTTTGAYNFTGADLTTSVFFYPSDPVMGLINYENSAINNEPVYAFDTQFSYEFTVNGWDRLGAALWTGDNADYFWGTNWRGANSDDTYLFVTNYNGGTTLTNSDTIKYWNGAAWTNFNPRFSNGTATNTIVTARIIVPFKDRLVFLNVVENKGVAPGTNSTFVNRCRFSWNGNPVDTTSFYEDIPGKGGYIDAPTKEAIITAQFLYDRLIVYFERSTWELVYTGNQILPFVWQKINTELGAESTFSQVPFDKVVLGVGNVGIHACNGSNVDRIDGKIPDSVFEVHNVNNGLQRVAGIRDFYAEMVYWTFPSVNRTSLVPFNDKVLVYNYKTGSWAFNDDSITSFGYYQPSTSVSQTWESVNDTWEEMEGTWAGATLQAQHRSIIAGNQEGYVFIIDIDKTTNDESLQITDLTIAGTTVTITSYNHNLNPGFNGEGDYVYIKNCQGTTELNESIFPIDEIVDEDTFTIINVEATGVYTGGGTITRVSTINIFTKQYNFYLKQGRNASVNKVDFLVDKTEKGQISVDYFASSSYQSMVTEGGLDGALVGNGILETSPYADNPLERFQRRLWHSNYPVINGETVQFRIYLNDDQMRDVNISSSDFTLHAMLFYSNPTGSRFQ